MLLHLHLVHVKQHQDLFQSGDELPTTYFPLTAVVSLVVVLSNGVTIEAAMVGRDGVVSAASPLDGKMAVNRGVVQLGGEILVCPAQELKARHGKAKLFPDFPAPVIRNADAERELVMMRWACPHRQNSGERRSPTSATPAPRIGGHG